MEGGGPIGVPRQRQTFGGQKLGNDRNNASRYSVVQDGYSVLKLAKLLFFSSDSSKLSSILTFEMSVYTPQLSNP